MDRPKGWWPDAEFGRTMVAPIVLNFARKRVQLKLPGETESFRRLCAVIDQIQALKFGYSSDTETLQADADSHAQAFVTLYGTGSVRPKMHYGTVHTSPQIVRDECVLDTITNERDHKVPKAMAEQKQNLHGFERYVLIRTIASELQALEAFDERPHLLGREEWHQNLDCWAARGLFYDGMTVSTNDIVLTLDKDLVEVKACARFDAGFVVIGDELEIVSQQWGCVKAKRRVRLTMVSIAKISTPPPTEGGSRIDLHVSTDILHGSPLLAGGGVLSLAALGANHCQHRHQSCLLLARYDGR